MNYNLNLEIEMNKKNFIKRLVTHTLGFSLSLFVSIPFVNAQELENSLLWKISGKNLTKSSYLFGTIHITCDNGEVLPEVAKKALAQTEQLVLELDMDDPALMQTMQKLSVNPGMKNFSATMSKEDIDLVDSFYKERFGAGLAQLGIMKPFVLMSMLYPSYLNCEKQTAVETLLIQAVTTDKKEVIGLETVEEQMSIFDNMPEEEQIEMLVKSVKEFDENKADFAKLITKYQNQDIDALQAAFKDYPEYAKYEDELLGDRNKNWIGDLEKIMAEKSSFIGVGAAHLASENGVINLLREAGYTVEPVLEKVNP